MGRKEERNRWECGRDSLQDTQGRKPREPGTWWLAYSLPTRGCHAEEGYVSCWERRHTVCTWL